MLKFKWRRGRDGLKILQMQNFLNVDLAFWASPSAYLRLPKSYGSNSFPRVRTSARGFKQKKDLIFIRSFLLDWRRGRDSNSGWGRPHDGFQDRCIKPLCHLSMVSPFTDKLFTENFIKGQALFCILHIFFIMNRDADLIKEKNS